MPKYCHNMLTPSLSNKQHLRYQNWLAPKPCRRAGRCCFVLGRTGPKRSAERQQPAILSSSPSTSHCTPASQLPGAHPDPAVIFLQGRLRLSSLCPRCHAKPPNHAISPGLLAGKTSQSHQDCGWWQLTSRLTEINSRA